MSSPFLPLRLSSGPDADFLLSSASLATSLRGLAILRQTTGRLASVGPSDHDTIAALGREALIRARQTHDRICRVVDGLHEVIKGRADYSTVVDSSSSNSATVSATLSDLLASALTSRADLALVVASLDANAPFLLQRQSQFLPLP